MGREQIIRWLVMIGVFWGIGVDRGVADEGPGVDEQTISMVDALVEELASGDKAQRASVRRQLVQLGPLARARMEQLARQTDDLYVRQVLNDLLDTIDDADPSRNRLVVRTVEYPQALEPINLHLERTTLDEALTKLGEQVGVPVVVGEMGSRRKQRWPAIVARVELKDASFWEAAEALSEAFDVAVLYNEGALRVEPRFPRGEMGGDSDRIRVRFERLPRYQSFRFADDASAETSLSVHLTLHADPRLRVTGAAQIAWAQIEDNHGNSLLNPERAPMFTLGSGSGYSGSMLRYPAENPGDRVRILRGFVVADVIQESGIFTVEDLSNAQGHTADVGGVRIRIGELRQVDEEGRSFNLSLGAQNHSLTGEQWRASGWNQSGQMSGSVRVIDADGKSLRVGGGDGTGQGGGVLLTIQVRADGSQAPKMPLRLRMEVPVKTRQISVPFEFRDLPIP